jgi:hypothetical protein
MRRIVASKSTRWVHSHFVVMSVILLTGCTVPIATDPDRFNVGLTTISPLRLKTVALNNAYQTETLVLRDPPRLPGSVDLKALSEAALSMMSRAMEKHGIAISPEAKKTVTLAVTHVELWDVFLRGTAATVTVEARYPDGTTIARQVTEYSALQYGRAIDAAVRPAMNDLIRDSRFVAYLNAPDAVPPEPSIPGK